LTTYMYNFILLFLSSANKNKVGGFFRLYLIFCKVLDIKKN